MCTIRQMDDDLVIIEMFRPVGSRPDIADRAKVGTGYRCCQAPSDADDGMAACDESAAQRPADEAGGTGHQNARQASFSGGCLRPDCAGDMHANALEKPRRKTEASFKPHSCCRGGSRYHDITVGTATGRCAARAVTAEAALPRHRRLVFLVPPPSRRP